MTLKTATEKVCLRCSLDESACKSCHIRTYDYRKKTKKGGNRIENDK